MSYKIDPAIPMPGPRNRYPFATMEAGQSFEIVGEKESRKVRNAAYQYAKKVNLQLAREQAREAHPTITAEELDAVAPLSKGEPGCVEFALRKVSSHGEGEEAVHVYRLWRVS